MNLLLPLNMLNINNDYNLSLYFEFFVNYLNQFDVSTLDKNELLLFNDLFFKNFLSVFFNSEFLKIFIYFNNTITNNEFFVLLTNFLEIKEIFNLPITSDIEENTFFYIYLMDLFIELNVIYSFFISALFFINIAVSFNIENESSALMLIDLIYYNSLNYLLKYDVLNLKLYFNYIEKYNFDNFLFFFYNIFFFLVILLISNILRISKLTTKFDLFNYKFFFFMNTFSKTHRINLDILIVCFFLLIESLLFTIIQLNDNKVEFVELMHIQLIYFLCFICFFLLYKYSIHYFSFLEQSVIEGKVSLFILKQFIRDTSNTFALFLRFFVLLFRLNIYDGLDDFLDSYCIFFGEFNENSEISSISPLLLMSYSGYFSLYIDDTNIDLSDLDFTTYYDIFNLFFILFIDISNYWLFMLEEIFRVFLAFYIIYLIIFEVHSVNLSYLEDSYFFMKKN